MREAPGEVTLLLQELKRGDKDALNRLIPHVYAELRRLAAHYMKGECRGRTLQPTAVVHEAYLRLIEQSRADWQDRTQFLCVAGLMMRRILVDHARRRLRKKRDAQAVHLGIASAIPDREARQEEILAVDQALARLSEFDPQAGRVAELRYFAGMTVADTAAALGISPRTVKRDWAAASAWLRGELRVATVRQAPV